MSWHRHIWGARTRPPRAGDFCLSCPAEWTQRGRGDQYQTDQYRARTRRHQITAIEHTSDPADKLASYIRDPGSASTLPGLDSIGGADMSQGTRARHSRKARIA